MSGRASQRKGRTGELELVRLLQSHGIPAEPGKPVSYGSSPDITGVPGIHIECKRSEILRLSDWMAQATADAEKFGDGLPVVFHRKNREGWRVTMALPDWLTLYRSYQPPGQSNYRE